MICPVKFGSIINCRMKMKSISISSPIEEKIEWADLAYQTHGRKILENKAIVEFLKKLKDAIPASHSEMLKTGIVELCRQCEQDEGGSCCGYGLENRYDGWVLLMNRLLGVPLPKTRRDPKSCFFLGEKGCVLLARHVICINYICRKISDRIDPQKILALREKEGTEINLVFLFHERLKKTMKDLHE